MTGPERGWLLLCADLGDGQKPLTPAQLRGLRRRVRLSVPDRSDFDRALRETALRALGYEAASARRILALLERERALEAYLETAALQGIRPLTPSSPDYPPCLYRRLGEDAPAVLFYRGDLSLLSRPAVSLTGSRVLDREGEAFARRVGELAAAEGRVLVSGNAAGADRTAQTACLAAGGRVVSILPGPLQETVPEEGQLLLCETGWHLPFTTYRALGRNRLIYALGEMSYVAKTGLTGGTFSGAAEALRRGGCPILVRDDGSPGSLELIRRGAVPASLPERLVVPAAVQLPLRPEKGEEPG